MTIFPTANGPKPAKELTVGTKVRVLEPDGTSVWDEIFMVKHEEAPTNTMPFLRITGSQHTLTVTGNHYVHRGAECCGPATLVPAAALKIGDTIWAVSSGPDGEPDRLAPEVVIAIDTVHRTVGYNVWLLQSDASQGFRSLVADGVAAVSFTTEVRLMERHGGAVSDKLYEPLRALYRSNPSLFLTREAKSLRHSSPLMRAALDAMGIIADCVEEWTTGTAANCEAAAVERRVKAIIAEAEAHLPARFMQDALVTLSDLQESSASGQLVPQARRKLMQGALAFVNASDVASVLVSQVVISTAMSCCEASSSCHVPVWSIPVIALVGVVVAILLVLLAALAWRLRARRVAATACNGSQGKVEAVDENVATGTLAGGEKVDNTDTV